MFWNGPVRWISHKFPAENGKILLKSMSFNATKPMRLFFMHCLTRTQVSSWLGQGCQMVPNVAEIAKNHCFPKHLPTYLEILFCAIILQFWDYVSNNYPNFREIIQLNINRCELSFWPHSTFREAHLLVLCFAVKLKPRYYFRVFNYESKGIISQKRIRDYDLNRGYLLSFL